MKKLFALSFIGSSLLLSSSPAKADWDYWGMKRPTADDGSATAIELYTINSKTGTATSVSTKKCFDKEFYANPGIYVCGGSGFTVNQDTGNFEVSVNDGTQIYNADTQTWTLKTTTEKNNDNLWKDDYSNTYQAPEITLKDDGSINFGAGGEIVLVKKSSGEIHLGENSWITKEENGKQKVYAKDANGNPIPIDYTNGTKLLINGRDVEQSINNIGALSAALTGLPTVPTNTTLACGLGTGTHGGDFAFAGGCASKVNEKLSINYAASMTMPGQDYAGDFEDTFSARAGFVWKLGKSTKPTQISMKETKELKEEIADLKENNKNIIAQNNALLARLERLEKVALRDLKTKDLAVYQLK
ncbi:YadA C-terminal domain-containing protein [bacterium]|nr:YadA C-terminal domain-containing protein [bacterium]